MIPTLPHPTRARRDALRRVVASVLLVLASLPGLPQAALPRALADPTPAAQPIVTVTLSQVSPSSPKATDTLTITGTVQNTSSSNLSLVQVYLWRSTDEVGDTDSLSDVLASEPDNPLGRRLVTDKSWFDVTDVDDEKSQVVPSGKKVLAPRESAKFTVTAPLQGDAGLGLGEGVHLVGVQVRGQVAGRDELQTLGRARDLVTVAPASTATTVTTHPVVLLDTRPSLLGGQVLADDHVSQELDGRLASLLRLAQRAGTTVLVDPALYDTLTAMSKGYTVHATPAPSATALAHGQRAAQAFLAALQPLLVSGSAYRLPTGNPDVRLAVSAGHTDVVTAAATLPSSHRLASLPLAVVPTDGILDDQTVTFLKQLKPSVVLASNLSSVTARQSVSGLSVVRYSIDVFGGGPSPAPTGTVPQVVGRLQAEQRLGRDVTSVATTAAQADAELAAASWRRPATLAALLSANSAVDGSVVAPTSSDSAPSLVQVVSAVQDDITTWNELVDRPADVDRLRADLLGPALSARWAGNAGATRQWLTAAEQQRGLRSTSGSVSLRATASFVTSSTVQEIPVTVTNSLRYPATVRIDFTSESPQRIDVADSEAVTVSPGDSETVKVRVTARANGDVGVQARLVTTSGRPVGSPVAMTITSTQAGRVGWIIIITSGVVLLAGTATRIRQVQRERREDPDAS